LLLLVAVELGIEVKVVVLVVIENQVDQLQDVILLVYQLMIV
tara:strand:+ start:103 stop:228 length:126 start_codon:yes stop_codon:yes gene_type:complete